MIDNQAISMDQPIMQNEGNIVSDMDGEKVMLNIHNGKYYNLGSIGGRIWELLENPATIQQVVSQLITEYEVVRTECECQVASFLDHLHAEGIITYAEREDDEPSQSD